MSPSQTHASGPEDGVDGLALVRGARAGDPAALERLAGYFARVPAVLRGRNRALGAPLDADELEDAVQETFRAVWSKLGEFEGRSALSTWIHRFALVEHHKAVERKQRRRRVRPAGLELDGSSGEPARDLPIDPDVLHAKLAGLESPEALVVRARHFEQRSFEDIARDSGEPLGTVKARYYRAIERLRAALAMHWRLTNR